MPMLRVEALTKGYPVRHSAPVRAVAGISFEVAEREILCLVGPSGCGKTTTLRLIAGLETPDSGSMLLDGKSLQGLDPSTRGVAMVFQNLALYPHLTVHQNIAFPLKARGVGGAEIQEKVSQAINLLGLNRCLDRLPESISGGEKQRVALARAWVQSPRLLLLDEPFTGLDAPRRHELRLQIRSLLDRSSMAVIQVTHDQAEALGAGDQIIVMHAGRIEQRGTPERVYREPESLCVAQFIGNPAMNCLKGTLVRTRGQFEFQSSTHQLRIPLPPAIVPSGTSGSPVFLGIRAENLRLTPPGDGIGRFEVHSAAWEGPGWLLQGRWDGETVWVKSGGMKVGGGSIHGLQIDYDALSWFDGGSGRRLP